MTNLSRGRELYLYRASGSARALGEGEGAYRSPPALFKVWFYSALNAQAPSGSPVTDSQTTHAPLADKAADHVAELPPQGLHPAGRAGT